MSDAPKSEHGKGAVAQEFEARVGECEWCSEVREGWSTCSTVGFCQESGNFYCEVCWGEYDAQGGVGTEDYAGKAWHDEILNAEILETGHADSGQALEFLKCALAEMSEPMVPLIAALSVEGDIHGVDASEASEQGDDAGEEEQDELMPLPGEGRKNWNAMENPELLGTSSLPSKLCQQAAGAHIVLLVDTSGSMRTVDVASQDSAIARVEAVQETLQVFMEAQAESSSANVYSMVSFNARSKVHFSRKSARQALAIIRHSPSMTPCQGTEFIVGLAAVKQLVCGGLDVRAPHIVVLSDGRPNDSAKLLKRAQQMLIARPGLRIHAIGFGDSADTFDMLQQLTSIGNGTFVPSRLSVAGLHHAFSSVSSTITNTQTSTSAFTFRNKHSSRGTGEHFDSTDNGTRPCPRLRQVTFEPPNQFFFGENRSITFECSRSWFAFDGHEVRCYSAKAPSSCSHRVSLRLRPFTQGGMRLVYCFQDTTIPLTLEQRDEFVMRTAGTDARMVAKLSKYTDAWHNSEEVASTHACSSAVAKFYARIFTLAAAHVLGWWGRTMARIIFLECYRYTFTKGTGTPPASVMVAERYLPGIFLKYNSNKGYVNREAPDSEVVQAFSHFTYRITKGTLMVLDLQGVHLDKAHRRRSHLILTDPQVVSIDKHWGPGDLGSQGDAVTRTSEDSGLSLQPTLCSGARDVQGESRCQQNWEMPSSHEMGAMHLAGQRSGSAASSTQLIGNCTIVHGPDSKKATFSDLDLGSLAEKIAFEFEIPKEPPSVSGTSLYRVERKMEVSSLCFTQNSISSHFRDGRPIYGLLNDINEGDFDPLRDLEPLDVVFHAGLWMSLSNRRLWALKHSSLAMAGEELWVRVRARPADKEFQSKRTTKNNGESVIFARSRSPSPGVSIKRGSF
ncbi:unnamed protein product [Polarella glacialis]|uniref:Alpha-type protein kinase domain-containing protein n=1 Tax=Polarella glacialis TaxID=89957 RepID=A0A813L074_POLGL|nr:unnamed protein product [Polarella glacialis]